MRVKAFSALGAVALLLSIAGLAPTAATADPDTSSPTASGASERLELAEAEWTQGQADAAIEELQFLTGNATVGAPGEQLCPEIPDGSSAETYTCITLRELSYATNPPTPIVPTDETNKEAEPPAIPPLAASDSESEYALLAEPVLPECTFPDSATGSLRFDRHQACFAGIVDAGIFARNGAVVGSFTVKWYLSVATSWNSTTVRAEFGGKIENIDRLGAGSGVTLQPTVANATTNAVPTNLTVTHNGQTFDSGVMNFSAGDLDFQEIIRNISVGTTVVLSGPPGGIPGPPARYTFDRVRCDRALSVRATSAGCVVNTHSLMLEFDAGRHPDFSRHVLRSIDSGATVLLTRADDQTNARNRATACPGSIAAPEEGRSCDEYPFASTTQGAASPNAGSARTFGGCIRPDLPAWRTGASPRSGWSACYINDRQNSGAGGVLGHGYTIGRVIPGDAFTITFSNEVGAVDGRINMSRNWNHAAVPPLPDLLATHADFSTTPSTISVSWWPGTVGESLFGDRPTWNSRRLLATQWSEFHVNSLLSNVYRSGVANPIGLVRSAGQELYYHAATGSGGLGPAVRIGSSGWLSYTEISGTFDWGRTGRPGFFARHAPTGILNYYAISPTGSVQSAVQVGTGWNSIPEMSFAGRWNEDIYPDLVATRSDGSLWLYRGTNGLSFGSAVRLAASGFSDLTGMIGAADWDLDGDPDLLVARTNGSLTFYPNTGGVLGSAITVGTGWANYGLID